jgi:hypothetical protein
MVDTGRTCQTKGTPRIIDKPASALPNPLIRLGLFPPAPNSNELHPRAAPSRPGAPPYSRPSADTWLTSFVAPTEDDSSGLRENFDMCPRWRSAIRPREPCRASQIIRARTIIVTGLRSAPMGKMTTVEVETGRRRGVRRQLERQETSTITVTVAVAAVLH